MKAIAQVRMDKLIQHAALFPCGTLHVKSGVHLCVNLGEPAGQLLLVEAEHVIAADGQVSAPIIGLPRYYCGPWSEAVCEARIGDYIGWRRDKRANWIHGDVLWPNRVLHRIASFDFVYDDEETLAPVRLR